MATDNPAATPPAESEPDGFGVLQHRLFSVIQRMKLAVHNLTDYDGISEDHIPAVFVVEEASLALPQLHDDFDRWHVDHKYPPKDPKEVQS